MKIIRHKHCVSVCKCVCAFCIHFILWSILVSLLNFWSNMHCYFRLHLIFVWTNIGKLSFGGDFVSHVNIPILKQNKLLNVIDSIIKLNNNYYYSFHRFIYFNKCCYDKNRKHCRFCTQDTDTRKEDTEWEKREKKITIDRWMEKVTWLNE